MGKKWGIFTAFLYLCEALKLYHIMATVTFRISAKRDPLGNAEVLVRFRHGAIDQYSNTGVFGDPDRWDSVGREFNIEQRFLNAEKRAGNKRAAEANARLAEIRRRITEAYNESCATGEPIARGWLDGVLRPAKATAAARPTVMEVVTRYARERRKATGSDKGAPLSPKRKQRLKVVRDALARFFVFTDLSETIDALTGDVLRQFEQFLRDEHNIAKADGEYMKIRDSLRQRRNTPPPRGTNVIHSIMAALRAAVAWANENDITDVNGFTGRGKYEIPAERYGEPWSITADEREQLYRAKMPSERVKIDRDIFIFQCWIGCRVGDLFSLTRANIVTLRDGKPGLSYQAHKTKTPIEVPLSTQAMEIVERYADDERRELFPHISEQHYNQNIKKAFTAAGLTRAVAAKIDPETGEQIIRPMNEVASSHLARRAFVSIAANRDIDTATIATMSGHNSDAIERYRHIETATQRRAIEMMEAKLKKPGNRR